MKKEPKTEKQFPSAESPSHRLYVRRGVCGFLLLAVVIVFGQTVTHDFVNYDDDVYVFRNPYVLQGLTEPGIQWAFTTGHAANWHPITWISHMLDCQVFGLHAGGHHLTSVLLHAATAILLFLVLLRMTGDLWPCAFVAVVFAIHPLRAESVAWVAERKDVLSGFFFMLTIAAYVRYVRQPFSLARYLMVAMFLALGLMSKPMLVTTPFVLLLLDYWPLGRMAASSSLGRPTLSRSVSKGERSNKQMAQEGRPLRWLIAEKLPLLALSAVSCVATILAQRGAMTNELIPLQWRLANGLVSYVAYLGQLFWPLNLAVLYVHPQDALPAWKIVGAALMLLGISAGICALWRKCPYLLVGWLWFLGMLVPVVGLVQVGEQAMADRYTYLPLIGPCIGLAWGIDRLLRSWSHGGWARGALTTVTVGCLMVGACWQTSFWRNSETLWKHTLTVSPRSSVVLNDLGTYYLETGRLDEAIATYEKALKIKNELPKVHNNLGLTLARRGRIDEAVEHYRKALQLVPDYPEANNNLANALAALNRFDEAATYYRKALNARPGYQKARVGLGLVLGLTGRLDEGAAEIQTVLDKQPNSVEAQHALDALLAQKQKIMGVLDRNREVLGQKPDDLALLNGMAWTLATNPNASIRSGEEAVSFAEHAAELSKNQEPIVLNTLAAAYAEAGRFSDAVRTAQKALELASSQNKKELADALRTRIKLYQAGSPYRQP